MLFLRIHMRLPVRFNGDQVQFSLKVNDRSVQENS